MPLWFSVAPVTRSPARFSTGIGSPESIDSSTLDAPSSTRASTGIFSPGRTRSRSPTCTSVERHVVLEPVLAHEPRGRGREPEQRAERVAGAPARAQLEHLTEQHERDDHRRGLEVRRDRAAVAAKRLREQMPGASTATRL